jgi:cytochrome c oxidase subunit 2
MADRMRRAALAATAVATVLAAVGGLRVLGLGAQAPTVVRITAKRFEYNPPRIVLKKGVPVVLELTALDRTHGFKVPSLGLRTDVLQDQVVRIPFVPDKVGTFAFACDIFCGDGHEDMEGKIVVEE